MSLSPHFSVEEFDCHDGTPYPKEWIDLRLKPLASILETIRLGWDNEPINISSGYRSPSYNRKIGGAKNSQHVYGRAADIWMKNIPVAGLHSYIRHLYDSGRIDLGGLGLYPTFVHVDIRPTDRLHVWSGSRKTS